MKHDSICILHLSWLVKVGMRLSFFVLVVLSIPSITYKDCFAEAHTPGTNPCKPSGTECMNHTRGVMGKLCAYWGFQPTWSCWRTQVLPTHLERLDTYW
jgi:hypothetical protein